MEENQNESKIMITPLADKSLMGSKEIPLEKLLLHKVHCVKCGKDTQLESSYMEKVKEANGKIEFKVWCCKCAGKTVFSRSKSSLNRPR